MIYVTADSYKGAERVGEPFDKKGKKYTKIKFKCDRCVNGIYAVGVENGSIKPHPAYNGVCLKCGGTGWLQKEVRLYTEQEYERNKAAAERAKAKREEVRKQEIEANYEKNRAKWLEKNGFSAEGDVYLIKGETYSIKDELKAAGFKYDLVLGWHAPTPALYNDRLVKFNIEDLYSFSADGNWVVKKEGMEDLIKSKVAEDQSNVNSDWVGEVGDHIKKVQVTLKSKRSFYGKFGLTNVYTFQDDKENIYTWFTTVEMTKAVNDVFFLKGTIKKHDEYNGTKQTVLTRCRVVE